MSAQAGPSRPRAAAVANTIDNEVAFLNLAAQLSLEDIDTLQAAHKGKQRQGAPISDAELALNLFAEDARALAMFNNDRALAQSLSLETDTRAPTYPSPIHPTRAPQQVPAGVHTVQRGNTQPPAKSNQTWTSWFKDLFVPLLYLNEPSPSTVKAPASTSPSRLTGHTCVICQDPIRGFEIRAPCGDYYDKDCACDLFEASTRDESLFPPRCCRQPIPLRLIQSQLSPNLVTLFNEKTIELGTSKRVYCANPTCSRFLGPQDQGSGWFGGPKLYNCTSVKCKTATCGRCKVAVDPSSSHVCREDTKDREVLAMGQTEGWARCPGCEQLIELNLGCYHMTCICKTQFCYLCRAIWKRCACPQWDERRLLAAAEARVDHRHAQHAPARAPLHFQNVAQRPIAIAPPPPRPRATVANTTLQRPVNLIPVPPRREPAPVAVPPRPALVARAVAPSSQRSSMTREPTPEQPGRNLSASLQETSSQRTQQWLPNSRRDSILHAASSRESALLNNSISQKPQGRVFAFGTVLTPDPGVSLSTPGTVGTRASGRAEYNQSKHINPSKIANPLKIIDSSKDTANAERKKLVKEAMDYLRVHHDCDHEKWKYRRGGGRCETCHQHLPIFLLRCVGCQILACRRCRQNRL